MSFTIREYMCPDHGRWERLEERSDVGDKPCEICGAPSMFVISAPHSMTVWATAVSTGKSDPPPHPLTLDTRPLADGTETPSQFRARRKKLWAEHDRAELRRKTGL